MKRDERLLLYVEEMGERLSRLLIRMELAQKKPVPIVGKKLYASQLHLIEAIGKGYGNTVTTLAAYFSVTKGAVSQIATKLTSLGLIEKVTQEGNEKERILFLTEMGKRAFKAHAELSMPTYSALAEHLAKYDDKVLAQFAAAVKELEEFF